MGGKVVNQPHLRSSSITKTFPLQMSERCFDMLKERWAILRGRPYYFVMTQCIMKPACTLQHNHVKREMPIGPSLYKKLFQNTL